MENGVTSITESEVKKWLTEQLDELCEDMTYVIHPYTYDDTISEDTVLKALELYKENPDEHISFKQCLIEKLWNDFPDIDYPLYDEIQSRLNEQSEEFQNAFESLRDSYGGDINELLDSCGFKGTEIDVEEFLGSYKVNLLLATESEMNYDMGAISDYFGVFEGERGDDEYKDNALTYLIEQQGYKPEQVFSEEKQSKFIESVKDELDGFSHCMGNVTVLIHLNGKELLDFADAFVKQTHNLEIPKNAFIGLYNEWQGGGSYLDIELEKPFVIKPEMIYDVQLEGRDGGNIGQAYTYTVDSVYGLSSSAWRDGMKLISKEAELKSPPKKGETEYER